MSTLTTLTCSLAIASTVALGAQSSKTTTTTNIKLKNGKDVKVTGCVASDHAGGYVLNNVADKTGALHSYLLVSDDDDFAKHVGHRVQIDGKVADRDGGKVEIRRETNVDGPAEDTRSKTEQSGPYLGVKGLTMIAASCP